MVSVKMECSMVSVKMECSMVSVVKIGIPTTLKHSGESIFIHVDKV